jgi:hypothetical protein
MRVTLFTFFIVAFAFVLGPSWSQAACVGPAKTSFRKQPRAKSKEIYSAAKYFPFLPTGKSKNGYTQVQDMDGRTGWVRSHDLNWHWNCVTVRVRKSKLHSGPGAQFSSSQTASKGASFLDLGGEDGWTQIQNADGEKQWVNLDHLWRPHEAMRMSFEAEHP